MWWMLSDLACLIIGFWAGAKGLKLALVEQIRREMAEW
jgi:hypothetical protein